MSNPSYFVLSLRNSDSIDSGLDIIYNTISHLGDISQFYVIDRLIQAVSEESLETDFMLGILCASMPYRKNLEKRDMYGEHCRRIFAQRGEDTNELLKGLHLNENEKRPSKISK